MNPQAPTLDQLFDRAFPEHRAPAAVLHYFRNDCRSCLMPTGFHTYAGEVPVKSDHLFDLASLTKVISTTTLVMLAVQEARLNLDDTVDRWLPERRMHPGVQPTLRQLLAHCGGLPACIPFHALHADVTDYASQQAIILHTPLEQPPQTATVYSDIGFILLGFILERLYDTRLDSLFADKIARPLGMSSTFFNPPPAIRSSCVPTERISGTSQETFWQGIVHDENARWLGGTAGHAGLFSTARDLALFADMMLKHGNGFIQADIVNDFTRTACLVPASSRCLGWDSPTQPGSSGGELIGPRAFGHTGFTGTTLWIDPEPQIAVILLTNAVHPSRECKKRYFPWRNQIHTLATRELLALQPKRHAL